MQCYLTRCHSEPRSYIEEPIYLQSLFWLALLTSSRIIITIITTPIANPCHTPESRSIAVCIIVDEEEKRCRMKFGYTGFPFAMAGMNADLLSVQTRQQAQPMPYYFQCVQKRRGNVLNFTLLQWRYMFVFIYTYNIYFHRIYIRYCRIFSSWHVKCYNAIVIFDWIVLMVLVFHHLYCKHVLHP